MHVIRAVFLAGIVSDTLLVNVSGSVLAFNNSIDKDVGIGRDDDISGIHRINSE